MPAFIVDSLLPLAIDIGSVVPDARNARLHSARSITAIQESLRQFGQRKPIIVQRQGMVVRAGNGTLEAARRLGWDRIAAVLLDDSDATAQAYAIADNRTAELAEWDFETLAGTLKALKDTDIDINALGWADFELEPLLQAEWKPPQVDEDYAPTFGAKKGAENAQDAGRAGAADEGGEPAADDAPEPEPRAGVVSWVGLTAEQAAVFEEAVRVLANREDRPVSNGEAVAMLAQQVL